MTVTRLAKENHQRSTWKNGLGYTDQIAIHPPGAVLSQMNFLWRISSARIDKASPFSVFPDHDRVLIILKGAGIKLFHAVEGGEPEEEVVLPPHEPYEFPGDVPSRCELLDGPITDFSVFVRKGEVEPQVELITVPVGEAFEWVPTGRWNFAFVVSGTVETEAGRLSAGDALSADSATRIRAVDGPSELLLVGLA